MKRYMVIGAVAASALAACTGCAAGSTAATNSQSVSVTSAAAGGTTASPSMATTAANLPSATALSTSTGHSGGSGNATNSGSGSGSGSGSSALATCSPRYLNGTIGASQGTAGSVYVNIVFKNLNNKPCTLDGYPGVSFGAGTPVTQVGQPADRNPAVSPKVVTLLPGGHAYAVLQINDAGNFPSGTCQPTATTYLQVYPPNTTNQLYIAYNSTGCKGNVVTLHVEAVQPGTGN